MFVVSVVKHFHPISFIVGITCISIRQGKIDIKIKSPPDISTSVDVCRGHLMVLRLKCASLLSLNIDKERGLNSAPLELEKQLLIPNYSTVHPIAIFFQFCSVLAAIFPKRKKNLHHESYIFVLITRFIVDKRRSWQRQSARRAGRPVSLSSICPNT